MRFILLFFVLLTFVRAQNNYMLSFDAANSEYTQAAVTANSNQTGFFSVWVVIDNFDETFPIPIAFTRTDGSTRWLRTSIRATGKVRITQRNNDVQDQVESNNVVITIGTKHHFVYGSDGSDFLLWIDGVSQAVNVLGGSNSGDWLGDVSQGASDQSFTLGAIAHSIPGGFFPGDLDEIVYSSTTPTQTIVADIYNSGTPKDETNASLYTLVHYWRLEEGTGQTAADSKGSLNMTLGATGGEEAADPTWAASTFGWDAGVTTSAFKKHKGFTGFKGW